MGTFELAEWLEDCELTMFLSLCFSFGMLALISPSFYNTTWFVGVCMESTLNLVFGLLVESITMHVQVLRMLWYINHISAIFSPILVKFVWIIW